MLVRAFGGDPGPDTALVLPLFPRQRRLIQPRRSGDSQQVDAGNRLGIRRCQRGGDPGT